MNPDVWVDSNKPKKVHITPGTADDKDLYDTYLGVEVSRMNTIPASPNVQEDVPTVLPRQIMTGTTRGIQIVGSGPDKIDGAGGRIILSDKSRFWDSVDNTKQAQFIMSGITTKTTRSYTLPNASGTIAISDATLSFTDITTGDVSTTKHGFAPKAPSGTTKFLRADSTWAVPGGSGATTASNTYVGNGGTNTAIAHGLGATPKFVTITRPAAWGGGILGADSAEIIRFDTGAAQAVTAMDGTNFYVSGIWNTNASTYYWFAIT